MHPHFSSVGGSLFSLAKAEDVRKWLAHPQMTPLHALQSVIDTHEALQRGSRRLAILDVSIPLEPQFKTIQMLLAGKMRIEQRRAAVERVHAHKWLTYARILDAKAAGEADHDIADVVFPEKPDTYESGYLASKNVENHYKRALALTTTFALGIANREN